MCLYLHMKVQPAMPCCNQRVNGLHNEISRPDPAHKASQPKQCHRMPAALCRAVSIPCIGCHSPHNASNTSTYPAWRGPTFDA